MVSPRPGALEGKHGCGRTGFSHMVGSTHPGGRGRPPDVIHRRPVSVGLLGPDPSVAAFNPSVVRESKEELTDERPGF